jgi:tight adherence protein B
MGGAMTPLVYVIAFAAVALLAWSIGSLVLSRGDRRGRVNRRMAMLESGAKSEDVYQRLVRRSASNLPEGELRRLHDRVYDFVHQAGLGFSPLRLLGFWLVGAVGLWLVSLVLLQHAKGALLLNGAVSMFGATALSFFGIWVWVSGRRRARLKKIEEQLPLALDIINRAIRAGHPIISAIQLSAQELGDPIGSELGLIVDETTYGMDFKDTLVNFAMRTGSSDAHFFAVSVGIQSETGGNLGEILEGLATVIRGRVSLDLKVKALASEGRISAYILSALPVIVIGALALLQPRFYTDKFSEPVFWPVVAGVVVLYWIGWVMIQRIINFKY